MCDETGFNQQEIKRIYKRFVGLDTLKRGYVTVADLMSIPEVDNNPLGERICKTFAASNTEGDDQEFKKNIIDFKEFVKALSIFHT